LGKERFLCFELARMDTSAEASHSDWVFEVEHLVVKQVFDGVPGA
jgi:hypothetical protein